MYRPPHLITNSKTGHQQRAHAHKPSRSHTTNAL